MSSEGSAAAYGARSQAVFHARRGLNRALRLVAEPPSSGGADYLHFWPEVDSEARLADLAARISWYLPRCRVPVYVPGARGMALDAGAAPWMDPALVTESTWTRDRPDGRALRVLHDVRPTTLLAGLRHLRHSSVADARLSLTSEYLGYRRLSEAFDQTPTTDPGETFPRFLERTAVAGGTAFVLGTGPSAALVDPDDVTADVRIVCNSTVRNLDLVRALQPQVIVFGDPMFHFGPSRYAAAFRRDLERALEVCPASVVIPESYSPLFAAHCPDLVERLVTVRVGGDMNIPSTGDPRVCDTGNILTLLMMPLAFALADTVLVAGCDGRQPGENYFWKHSPVTQYSDDLMQSVFDAHPGFFRHRSYTDYYSRHCAQVEELAALGESAGKELRGDTPSWIPALATRGAPVPR